MTTMKVNLPLNPAAALTALENLDGRLRGTLHDDITRPIQRSVKLLREALIDADGPEIWSNDPQRQTHRVVAGETYAEQVIRNGGSLIENVYGRWSLEENGCDSAGGAPRFRTWTGEAALEKLRLMKEPGEADIKPQFLTYVDGTDGYCSYGDSPTPALALARELHAGMDGSGGDCWDFNDVIYVGRSLDNTLLCHAKQISQSFKPEMRATIIKYLHRALSQAERAFEAEAGTEGWLCSEYRAFLKSEYQPILDALKAGQTPEEAAKALPFFSHETYEFRQVHRPAQDRPEAFVDEAVGQVRP